MNVKKGLFRLMVVFSILIGVFAGIIVFTDVYDDAKKSLRNKQYKEIKAEVDQLARGCQLGQLPLGRRWYFDESYHPLYNEWIKGGIGRKPEHLQNRIKLYEEREAGGINWENNAEHNILEFCIETMSNDVISDRLRYAPRGFWAVLKHKPLHFFLPIPGFLAGFLGVWMIFGVFYYTIRYIIRGFLDSSGKASTINEANINRGTEDETQEIGQNARFDAERQAIVSKYIRHMVYCGCLEE